jgi:hypothetical protein
MGVKDVRRGRKITNCMALPCDAAIVCGPVQDANLAEQAAKLAFSFVDPGQKEWGLYIGENVCVVCEKGCMALGPCVVTLSRVFWAPGTRESSQRINRRD